MTKKYTPTIRSVQLVSSSRSFVFPLGFALLASTSCQLAPEADQKHANVEQVQSRATSFAPAVAGPTHTITGAHYYLKRENWNATSHQAGGTSRIGGYTRSPATAYDFETLAKFSLTGLSGPVKSARLRFNVTGRNLGSISTVTAFAQDLASWSPSTVRYSDFGDGPWTNNLGSVDVGTSLGWKEMSSPALANLVQSWIEDPSKNRGLVLTANFYHWGYYVSVNQVELVVELESLTDPDSELPDPNDESEYFLVGEEHVELGYVSEVRGHNTRSNADLLVASDAEVLGDVDAERDVTLNSDSAITGSVHAGGIIHESSPGSNFVSGAALEGQSLTPFDVPSKVVAFGTQDVVVPPGTTVVHDIEPGNYRDITIQSGATVRFSGGEYNLRSLTIADGAYVEYILLEEVHINVQDKLLFGDHVDFRLMPEVPLSIKYYTNQSTPLEVSDADRENFGVFTAPYAALSFDYNSRFVGAAYAREVEVGAYARVTCPPLLRELYHEETALAPTFDPFTTVYHRYRDGTPGELGWVYASARDPGDSVYINSILVDPAIGGVLVPLNLNSIQIDVKRPAAAGLDPMAMGGHHVIHKRQTGDHRLFVDDTAPCSGWACNGQTWDSAIKDLQVALDIAAISGQEIWLAEGTYRPSKRTNPADPRSATFSVLAGHEIRGIGDADKIILSGDLANNDTNAWPRSPSVEGDNAYHVLTFRGRGNRGIRVDNLTISGGVADGPTLESKRGGGILNLGARPSLHMVVVRNNVAEVSGGGVYSLGHVRGSRLVVLDNTARLGYGGGWYGQNAGLGFKDFGAIGNRAQGEAGRGGAIYVDNGTVSLTSSVLANNYAGDSGGAFYLRDGAATLLNLTSSKNEARLGGGGIVSESSEPLEIHNSILWHDRAGSELCGASVCYEEIIGSSVVTYSNVSYAGTKFPGVGNVQGDPAFKDPSSPLGEDDRPGTADDGLRLALGSASIANGDPEREDSPGFDVIGWPYLEGTMDMGAYRFRPNSAFLDVVGTMTAPLTFVPSVEVRHMESVGVAWPKWISFAANSTIARAIRMRVPKHNLTDHDELVAYVYPTDTNGNRLISVGAEVTFYLIADHGDELEFATQTAPKGAPGMLGVPVVFSGDMSEHGFVNPIAHILYGGPGIGLELVLK